MSPARLASSSAKSRSARINAETALAHRSASAASPPESLSSASSIRRRSAVSVVATALSFVNPLIDRAQTLPQHLPGRIDSREVLPNPCIERIGTWIGGCAIRVPPGQNSAIPLLDTPLPETSLPDQRPDLRRSIDWARLRAATAGQQIAGVLGDRSRWNWRMFASIAAGGVLLFVLALWVWIYWGLPRVPDADALWALNRQQSVMFVDAEGEIIGVRGPYYGRRTSLEDLPDYVPQAFLAIEDRRFYQHEGVDRMAIFRALLANLRAGETVQGASTITQQLSRNLFLTPAQTINRKLREMVLASRIERRLAKDEILELYLNRVYLGEQAYGVDAAARRFFGKTAAELTLAEAAMLAGLPKAPSRSTPTENFERATARQHVVLDAMVEAGFITPEQRDAARAEEINVIERPNNERNMGYAFDLAVEQARNAVGREVPDLVIRMTIDRDIQVAAADSIRRRLG
ncbi:MAG: hypothetical protein DCF16_13665, partial [Alphaproteobacteria bacterium]